MLLFDPNPCTARGLSEDTRLPFLDHSGGAGRSGA
jgi:hypothetical protein